jgi:hypothetical protein
MCVTSYFTPVAPETFTISRLRDTYAAALGVGHQSRRVLTAATRPTLRASRDFTQQVATCWIRNHRKVAMACAKASNVT